MVRASGTEPVVRVMVEAADRVSARPSATTCAVSSTPRSGYNNDMCGIVGYVGDRECKELLLTGLSGWSTADMTPPASA